MLLKEILQGGKSIRLVYGFTAEVKGKMDAKYNTDQGETSTVQLYSTAKHCFSLNLEES